MSFFSLTILRIRNTIGRVWGHIGYRLFKQSWPFSEYINLKQTYEKTLPLLCTLNLTAEVISKNVVWSQKYGQQRPKDKKIKVIFLIAFKEHFSSLESIYRSMKNDQDFDVIIMTISRRKTGFTQEVGYGKDNFNYFNNDPQYDQVFDGDGYGFCFDLVTLNPDYVIVNTPWEHLISSNYHVDYLRYFVKVVYIPYGIMQLDIPQLQFNQKFHHLCWRIFCESEMHKQLFKKYSDFGDSNVVVSGYPKLDFYLNARNLTNPWKNQSNNKNINLIWAPHWTLAHLSHFPTFLSYFLTLIKENPNISLLIKPHPNLWDCLIHQKIYSQKEIIILKKKLRKISNCQIYEGANYFPYFQYSDALILDSISFLTEYLPTKKPIFFLNLSSLEMNEFGKKLVPTYYSGKTVAQLDSFIKTTVFLSQDPLSSLRIQLCRQYLFFNSNGAGNYIKDYLKKNLNK